jgi:hypothetical protein
MSVIETESSTELQYAFVGISVESSGLHAPVLRALIAVTWCAFEASYADIYPPGASLPSLIIAACNQPPDDQDANINKVHWGVFTMPGLIVSTA